VSENTAQQGQSLIDTSRPHSARVWDWLLGGDANYPVDRQAGAAYEQAFPTIRAIARTDRAFLARAVRHFTTVEHIDQFLDIGTGLPTQANTHEVAQQINPAAKIVYVDNDPLVLHHAAALLTSTPEGACAYIEADLREPATILRQAAKVLDYTRPVAVTLLGILHFVPSHDHVLSIVGHLMRHLPAGSGLAITHATFDVALADEATVAANRVAIAQWNAHAQEPMTPRTHNEIVAFFDGLELLDPGLVSMPKWRPDPDDTDEPSVLGYAGVGIKR
jgi:O-methyltransferase involved in polyketide biosynthesis